jgi:undecaprenyl-phosphate alpha-N-acetylglucosaminyl 1-phosphatetransferase
MVESLLADRLGLALLAPALSLLVIRMLMSRAEIWGLIDHPGHRKVHRHPTPLVGGLGILLTVLGLQAIAGQVPFGSWSLLAALAIVTAAGLADDARELGHRTKFAAQAIGAAIIVSGTSVWVVSFGDLLGLGEIVLGKWAVLVTIVAIVGVMNAINMIDGLDGLAGSVTFVPLAFLAAVAFGAGANGLAFELLVLAGALLGFLLMNLRLPGRQRAAVFMGDTGGMVLGMLLAWYSVKLGGGHDGALRPITAVWILAVPLLDMGSVMLLRIWQGKSPFHADQQHMHHVLLLSGYSVNQVVLIMSASSVVYASIGLLAQQNGIPESVMFATFVVLWAAYVLALRHSRLWVLVVRGMIRPAATEPGSKHG